VAFDFNTVSDEVPEPRKGIIATDRLLYSTFEKGSSLAPYLNTAKSAALKYLDTNHPSTISIRLEIKVLKIKGIAKIKKVMNTFFSIITPLKISSRYNR
jgi:hypothetical protein